MEGGKVTLDEVLRVRKVLKIPVYQRNYDWRVSHCMRLFSDIEKICDFKLQNNEGMMYNNHFLGSIVVEESDRDNKTVKVIDGQQRITTVVLILLSAYNILKEDLDGVNKGYIESLIKPILMDLDYTNGGNVKYKLVLNKKDQESYTKLYGEEHTWDESSNITINYRKIKEMMEDSRHRVTDIISTMLEFEFMKIKLNPSHDDVQLIFETINSTGKDLTPADKIRNLLLMGLDNNEQESKYISHWMPMENIFLNNLDTVNEFFKVYMNYKESRHSTSEDTYERYKRYSIGKSKKYLFDDMLEYSVAYKHIITQSTGFEDIDSILYRIWIYCGGSYHQIIGFLLPMIRDLYVKELSGEQVTLILEVFEVYLGRISLIPTADYKILKSVITRMYGKVKGIVNSSCGSRQMHIEFGNQLAAISGKLTLPTDDRLRYIFKNAKVGNMSLNKDTRKKYFFERIENGVHKERMHGMYDSIEKNEYTIEHIMPRKINSKNYQWKGMLGDNWEEIHEEYIDNIGNITLTGYNSEMSNKDFLTKKEMAGGYNDSHFPRLNKVQREEEVWNKDSILKRNDYLYELAKEIWPYPDFITYTEEDNIENVVTLLDIEYYSGITVLGYRYQGQNYGKSNWVDIYTQLLKEVVKKDPQKLYTLYEQKEQLDLSRIFRDEGEDIYMGIKVYTKNKTNVKIETLKYIFNYYEEDLQDVVFILE